MRTNCRLTAVAFTLGCLGSTGIAESLSSSANAILTASEIQPGPTFNTVFRASEYARYQSGVVGVRIRDIGAALLVYANDHDGWFPNDLSELFLNGQITDPCTFYNDGDTDPPPTMIDNDVLDAANSAQISFAYLVGGLHDSQVTPNTVMLRDNTPANHGGLGRFVVYADGHSVFEPEPGRLFDFVDPQFGPCGNSYILRGNNPSEPFDVPLPADLDLQARSAVHAWDLRAGGSIAQEQLDLFATEGFGDTAYVNYDAGGLFLDDDYRVIGPAGPSRPVTAYIGYDFLIRSPLVRPSDGATWNFQLLWQDYDNNFSRTAAVLSLSPIGLVHYGLERILDARVAQPGDPEYDPDAITVSGHGIAQVVVNASTDLDSTIYWFNSITTRTDIRPNASPGRFTLMTNNTTMPTNAGVSQVRLYLPPGYDLHHQGALDPNAPIGAYYRGDANTNGELDLADHAAFAAAFTESFEDPAFFEASFDDLHVFDFDGDGDIDCDDYALFVADWPAGFAPPDTIPQCDPPKRYLTVITGGGDVTLDPPGGIYFEGDTVHLTAQPDPSWDFVGWHEDATGTTLTTDVLMDANKTVIARFEPLCATRLTESSECQPPLDPNAAPVGTAVGMRGVSGYIPEADSLTFATDQTLAGLRWWGSYRDFLGSSVDGGDDFIIRIYADDAGYPGSLLHVFDSSNANFWHAFSGQRFRLSTYAPPTSLETVHTAQFESPIEVTAGQTLWFELDHGDLGTSHTLPIFWLWRTAGGGDATALIDRYIPGYDEIDVFAVDLTLCPLTADPLDLDCPGDLDNDNDVDFDDLNLLLASYDQSPADTTNGDLDGDCDVDFDDLNVLLANYGTDCGGNPTF